MQMAQVWLRFEEQADDIGKEASVPPTTTGEAGPVAQQQQQVQPKDDDNKD